MFRPLFLRPSLLLLKHPRPILRSPIQQVLRNESNVTVQRVRFKTRYFTRRRLAAAAIYTGAFYTYWHFVLGPDEDEEHEASGKDEVNGGNETYEDDEYEDDDAIFIPLTWASPRPRTFYKRSDPEWEEFRKLSRDRKRHARMREQLVTLVRTQLERDPRFIMRLGQINANTGNYWLDFIYPDGPPQEFERSGIEITDDHIYWTTKSVTKHNVNRLKRVLWPKEAFDSFYASTFYIFRTQLQTVKQLFGIATGTSTPDDHLQKSVREHVKRLHGTSSPVSGPQTSSTEAAQRTAESSPDGPKSGSPENGSNAKEKNLTLPEFSPLPHKFPALSIFTSNLTRQWKPLAVEPPRGTMIVTGLVEVNGNKASCTLDVIAVFDPKLDKYVILKVGIRRIQDLVQRPKGR